MSPKDYKIRKWLKNHIVSIPTYNFVKTRAFDFTLVSANFERNEAEWKFIQQIFNPITKRSIYGPLLLNDLSCEVIFDIYKRIGYFCRTIAMYDNDDMVFNWTEFMKSLNTTDQEFLGYQNIGSCGANLVILRFLYWMKKNRTLIQFPQRQLTLEYCQFCKLDIDNMRIYILIQPTGFAL